jgi:hypothetical protein
MLALILKLDQENIIIDVTNQDINVLLSTLRNSTILDTEGGSWEIEPNTELFFEDHPPHFEIRCKMQE